MWRTFWKKPAKHCFVDIEVKVPDSRTLAIPQDDTKFTYLELPDHSQFPCGLRRILITATYQSLYTKLCSEDLYWEEERKNTFLPSIFHSTIITGQPGIGMPSTTLHSSSLTILDRCPGKTTCLSYILVRRLQEGKETVYCNNAAFAYVFTSTGVEQVLVKDGVRIKVLDESPINCALVNISPGLSEVPPPFHPENRHGRLVVATSPNPDHVTAFRESGVSRYTLPTWQWVDIYCAW